MNTTKRNIKKLVLEMQKSQAMLDFVRGQPPRKRSKTYTEMYGRLYAIAECSARTTAPF